MKVPKNAGDEVPAAVLPELKVLKSDRTRRRVLDAAAKVFREQGYPTARLADVAKAAGMQTGSLYYYFESRDDLIGEVLNQGIADAIEKTAAAVNVVGPDASPRTRLEAAIRAHLSSALESSDYASAYNRIVQQVPAEIRRKYVIETVRYGQFWHELLKDCVSAGEIRPDVDLYVMRMLILGAFNSAAEWYNPRRGPSFETITEHALTLVFGGLGSVSVDGETPKPSKASSARSSKKSVAADAAATRSSPARTKSRKSSSAI